MRQVRENVLLLTTSNLTESIDLAFIDRADVKQFIGLPSLQARYTVLASCVEELARAGIIDDSPVRVTPPLSSPPSLTPCSYTHRGWSCFPSRRLRWSTRPRPPRSPL